MFRSYSVEEGLALTFGLCCGVLAARLLGRYGAENVRVYVSEFETLELEAAHDDFFLGAAGAKEERAPLNPA